MAFSCHPGAKKDELPGGPAPPDTVTGMSKEESTFQQAQWFTSPPHDITAQSLNSWPGGLPLGMMRKGLHSSSFLEWRRGGEGRPQDQGWARPGPQGALQAAEKGRLRFCCPALPFLGDCVLSTPHLLPLVTWLRDTGLPHVRTALTNSRPLTVPQMP